VAITDGGELLAERPSQIPGDHTSRLVGDIGDLLSSCGIATCDIEGIAVAIGPGSFTGLRVGLATAKGLAFSIPCRIAGASSLRSLALNGAGFDGVVVPLIDARRGELYAAAYRVDAAGEMEEVIPECVLAPESLLKRFFAMEEDLLLMGDGAISYRKILEPELRKQNSENRTQKTELRKQNTENRIQNSENRKMEFAEGEMSLPHASNLARLAKSRLETGGDDIAKLAINYIRKSDAEIGFLGRTK
jgi:tRNA threonylcarbamoyladenosine biosynthesis protein TsaB